MVLALAAAGRVFGAALSRITNVCDVDLVEMPSATNRSTVRTARPGRKATAVSLSTEVCQECRVVVDGVVVRSCVTPVSAGMRVTTGHT